ncbi:MAG: APC family permease [Candidatus Dormibacteraceae bacterium]
MSNSAEARRGRRPGDTIVVVRRRAKLPRTLGPGALFSACYGNVGSSIYYSLGVTAGLALGLTPLALILAGFIFVTTALNYAEGTAAMPHAGGSSAFARRAFNQPIGFLVGWIQLLNYTATVSISAYTATAYLGVLGSYVPALHLLQVPVWHLAAAVVLVVALMVVNVVGIQESSLINLVLALLDLATQVVLVILGLTLLLNVRTVISNVHFGVAPTWGNFLASISLAMVTFTGIETISNMSEEVKNPGKNVPRATLFVIIAVLIVSSFLPTVGMSVFPIHLDPHSHQFVTDLASAQWKNDPVSGIVSFFRPDWLAHIAGLWVAILAFTILVIATNAGLIGISRLSYSLASNDLFPKPFAALHPRFKTPYVAILVFGAAAALLIVPGRIDLMAAVYSLAATFAFCVAHLAVMRLRYVEPDLYRPYRMPFNISFGRSTIPLLSVVGALAIGAVFTQLLGQNIADSTPIYVVWLALGVIVFLAYRRYRGLAIWEPLQNARPVERAGPQYADAHVDSERVRLGRRGHVDEVSSPSRRAAPVEPIPAPAALPKHIAILIAVASLLTGAVAVAFDLSPFDPFGPGLGWSPGVMIVAISVAIIVLHGRSER